MGIETQPVPPQTWLDMFQSFFHRQDTLLGYMAETQREILALLRTLTGIPTPIIKVPPTPVTIVPPEYAYPIPVLPEPLGRVRKFNPTALITTASFAEVIGYAVTSGMEFDLANIAFSADQDTLVKLQWGGNDLTPTFYVAGKIPFVQWFPAKYYDPTGKPIVGDGQSKLSLQAAMPSGGSPTTYCFGEIVGDEVTPPSS